MIALTQKKKASIDKLLDISNRIKSLQAQYLQLVGRGALIAKEMGGLLRQAKKVIGNSKRFSKWCLSEFDMSRDTAHRYITIAANWEKIESHERFPKLNVVEMFDVARSRPIRDRSYKITGATLDTLLGVMEKRLTDKSSEYPKLQEVLEQIKSWRHVLHECGLLKRA